MVRREELSVGMRVDIVQKPHQRSGKLTRGVIRKILTKKSYHPHGIKVELEGGIVGRVKGIVS